MGPLRAFCPGRKLESVSCLVEVFVRFRPAPVLHADMLGIRASNLNFNSSPCRAPPA